MQIQRNEIRTGLLVVLTLAALVAALIYLGAPGTFVPQKTFRIYFDNVMGLKQGAYVQLAGRKIGQVTNLFTPVAETQRPTPKLEAMVEVQVRNDALIYNHVKVQMVQNGLLGEMLIDFSGGEEGSGIAPDGSRFIGERAAGLADIAPAMLERLDPVLVTAKATLESLQATSDNLAEVTSEKGALTSVLRQFDAFGGNLNELAGPGSSIRRSLANVEELTGNHGRIDQVLGNVAQLTGPQSDLSRAFENAESFTRRLATNGDLQVALKNFRSASDDMKQTFSQMGPQFSAVGKNLEQASDTVKRQPWRLIWPTTKTYPKDSSSSDQNSSRNANSALPAQSRKAASSAHDKERRAPGPKRAVNRNPRL